MAVKASATVTIADISDGIDGTGIKSTKIEYKAGSSGTTAPTGTWSTSVPATSASAPYLWTRVTYSYTDGSPDKIVYSVGSTPEGIVIGGRNLQLGSGDWNSTAWLYKQNVSVSSGVASMSSVGYPACSVISVDVGSTYTVSFDIKADVNDDITPDFGLVLLDFFDSGNSRVFYEWVQGVLTSEWQRVSHTFVVPNIENLTYLSIGLRNTSNIPNVYFKHLKVEKGNKATDWTPAPEDVDAKIETVSNALEASDDVIVGTQTATTASWTGVAKFAELKDGQRIAYWLPYNGVSNTNVTLNLTLSGGTTTGAIACYYSGTTRITTHYPAGNVIHLTYKKDVSINGSSTKYTGWWADANYDSGNTYDRTIYGQVIKAGTVAVTAGNLIVGKDGLYTHLKTGNAFDVTYPILYAVSNIAASGTGTNNYLAIPFTVTTTQNITLTQYKPVYIKGKLSGSLFTPASTTPLTQTVPTTNDGYQYILLGTAYSTTGLYLLNEHPIFQYYEGGFKTVEQIAIEAAKTATNYLHVDEAKGLIIGNLTDEVLGKNVKIDIDSVDICDGDTVLSSYGATQTIIGKSSGRNVLIDSDSVDIRSGSTVLATYTENAIHLGKNNSSTIINLCNGRGRISSNASGNGELLISSDYGARIKASNDKSIWFDTSYGTDKSGPLLCLSNKSCLIQFFDVNNIKAQTIITKNHTTMAVGRETGSTDAYISLYNNDEDSKSVLLYGNRSIYLRGSDLIFLPSSVTSSSYYPYYKKGDSISFSGYTAGYVSNSATRVYFTIPISKPIIGNPTLSGSSINGFKIRQQGKYTHGSTANNYKIPSSYSAELIDNGVAIRVYATFSDTTNAVNNYPCGVQVSMEITLS